ncbi:MAG: class I SAM-dependent methyltransferase [Gemmataceae bacterium]|nr:class I SAM-dependent methyltransferase [Gemmataceae bacterium]
MLTLKQTLREQLPPAVVRLLKAPFALKSKMAQALAPSPPDYYQWCRGVMDQVTEQRMANLHPEALDAMEISGAHWERFGFKSYTSLVYPEFDICQHALPESYDVVLAEQVFEHLLWPYRAGKNVYQMLRTGGYFLITTPFLIRVHNWPIDCSRWTKAGLRYFLAECGFSLDHIETGSWGNRACVVANFERWMPYRKSRHSLVNEPDFPLVVWALARKS